MKKSILFSMALVAVLSSCTKDNVDNNNENNDLVAIQFGAGVGVDVDVQSQKASRAPLGDDWNDTNVGMFVLANNKDADYVGETSRDVLWNNVSAIIAAGGKATPTLGGQPQYYPNGGDREFSFYGYHPYDATAANLQEKEITKTFSIPKGDQDIIWGKAEVTGGYNAAYFRQEGNEDDVPNVVFKHLLTQLKFQVMASSKFEEGQTLTVTKLEIVEVPTDLTLNIVEGTLVPGTMDKTITVYDNASGIEIKKGTAATDLGSSPVMLYSSNAEQKYKIVLTTKEGGVSQKLTIGSNFAVGTAYNVILSLNSNKTIEFTASLTSWGGYQNVTVEI